MNYSETIATQQKVKGSLVEAVIRLFEVYKTFTFIACIRMAD